jgi:methylated-DNA-protein-cysteine methyltransferase related protein
MPKSSEKARKVVKNIPKGKVSTYGTVAKLFGSSRVARQVAWLLYSSSRKFNLPWYRVVSKDGKITIKIL